MRRVVSKEGQFLGIILSEVLDVPVDPAEVPLHDARDQKKVGRVERRFRPSQSGSGESLPCHGGREGPHAVPLEHGGLGPVIQVSERKDLGRGCDTGFPKGPLEQPGRQRERFKTFCHRESAVNVEVGVPDTAAQPIRAFLDEDVSRHVDHLEVTSVQQLQALELPDKGLEAGCWKNGN
jgi:hypothetical protein